MIEELRVLRLRRYNSGNFMPGMWKRNRKQFLFLRKDRNKTKRYNLLGGKFEVVMVMIL